METDRCFGKVGIALLGGLLLAACGDHGSDLVLESGSREFDQVAPAGPTEVGKSKTETFTFRNVKDEGVVLKQLSGISKPFYPIDSSTCRAGELVPGHGTCTVVVTYVPTAAGKSAVTLSLSYAREKSPSELRPGPSIELAALSSLNCGATATLAQKRLEGVNTATQRNLSEAAAGTAKGQSLTYDDGRQAGYQQGYEAGYKQGYAGAYPRSFDSGHARGYTEGSSSSDAIREGSYRGQNDGSTRGYVDGAAAGDRDGYQDGYADGSAAGYADGYADGQAACQRVHAGTGAAARTKTALRLQSLRPRSQALGEQPPSPEQILNDPATQQACVKQGYDATYSASSFQRAYEAAAAANTAYQAGLRDGYASGHSLGSSEGSAAGQRQGYEDGRAQGYQQGYEYAFNAYYQSSYQVAYDSAYRGSYGDAYSAGGSRGYYAGYQVGYESGYADGAEDAGCTVD